MAEQPRIRESDGAVWVEGIGYVAELFSYGGKTAAGEAAREAVKRSQDVKIQEANLKADSDKVEKMGFG